MKTRYLDIDDRTEDLKDMMRAQKARAKDFLEKFDVSLIHHENALEGVVFSGAELMAALDPAGRPTEASMVPVFAQIRNHQRALDFIREEAKSKKASINLTLVKKLYELLGEGIDGRDKAVFRKDMPLHRSYFHDIAQPAKIQPALEKLFAFVATAEFKEMHPIQQAAHVQWSFMQAFPFTENCGKVARLLTNLLLVRAGYLPVIIHAIDRQRYYESFKAPAGTLRQLIVEAMENSLENGMKFFTDEKLVRIPRRAS